MFSYVDLVRAEIGMEAETRFDVTIPEPEMNTWLTLGDVARSIVGRAGPRTMEVEAVNWVRTLIVEGYGATEVADLPAAGDVFSDYDRAWAWFLAPPYPSGPADRCFAGEQGKHPGGSTESRGRPYYCAYSAPSDLTALPPAWRTDTVVSLARRMSESLDFTALPILADALQDAGCDNEIVLYHCRNPKATHIHGCWVVDLVLGEGRYQVGG
jgi:hypothetical protein